MKFTENRNAPNCRILAKQYLKCRMDHQLMEKSEWDTLGLTNLPGEKTEEMKFKKDGATTTSATTTTSSSAAAAANGAGGGGGSTK